MHLCLWVLVFTVFLLHQCHILQGSWSQFICDILPGTLLRPSWWLKRLQIQHRHSSSMPFFTCVLFPQPEISAPPTSRQWEILTLCVRTWAGKLWQGPEQSTLRHDGTEHGLWNQVPVLNLNSAVEQLWDLEQNSFSICASVLSSVKSLYNSSYS